MDELKEGVIIEDEPYKAKKVKYYIYETFRGRYGMVILKNDVIPGFVGKPSIFTKDFIKQINGRFKIIK